jgi:hypothetical protein
MQRTLATLVLALSAVAGCSSKGALGVAADAGADGGGSAVDALASTFADAAPSPEVASAPDAAADARMAGDLPTGFGACSAEPLGPSPLRRLTTSQYRRTVRDLAAITNLTTRFPPEELSDGFEGRLQVVSGALVEAWHQAADEVGAAMEARLETFLACPPTAIDDACVQSFLTNFGGRALRRPLTPGERQAYLAFFTDVRKVASAPDAVVAVARALLQSPHFLYLPEVGGTPSAGRIALTPWEVASRLSYFVWGTMPDSELFAAALADKLSSPEEIARQTERLLADPRAREGVADFFRQWLGMDEVLGAQKSPTVYPRWSPSLGASMREEGLRFVQHVMFDAGGKLGTLFTAGESILTPELGQLYGIAVTGQPWQRVSLAGTPRLGLLTQGWFLAGFASEDRSNPVLRGQFVRERLFCQLVPEPPPNVITDLPPRPGATTRERYAIHIDNPACVSCHNLIDPLGYPFESYDGIGVFRTTENGKPIDSSGAITGTVDSDGTVADAQALARRLAGSGQVRDCIATRWYEQSMGRSAVDADRCQVDLLSRVLQRSGGDLRELVVAITSSPSFGARRASEVAPPTTTTPIITNPVTARIVQKMILDRVGSQVLGLLQRHTSPGDRAALEAHLSGLRDLERRLAGP